MKSPTNGFLLGFTSLLAALVFTASVAFGAAQPPAKPAAAAQKPGDPAKKPAAAPKAAAKAEPKAASKSPSKTETKVAPKAAPKVAAKAAPTAKSSSKPVAKAPAKKKKKKKQDPAKVAKAPLPKSDWSPNRFPVGVRGWCTWYVDGRFQEFYGEKLEFMPRYGSNAMTWYERVQNVDRPAEAKPGDIMVMRRGKKDKRGHVAFVEEVIPGVGWLISHANFDFRGHQPVKTEIIDGRKVFYDIFVPGMRPGTVMLQGGNSVYNLLGFLRKDRPDLGSVMDSLAGAIKGKKEEAVAVNNLQKATEVLWKTPISNSSLGLDDVTCVITPIDAANALPPKESETPAAMGPAEGSGRNGALTQSPLNGPASQTTPSPESAVKGSEPQKGSPSSAEEVKPKTPSTSSVEERKPSVGKKPKGGEEARSEKPDARSMARL